MASTGAMLNRIPQDNLAVSLGTIQACALMLLRTWDEPLGDVVGLPIVWCTGVCRDVYTPHTVGIAQQ